MTALKIVDEERWKALEQRLAATAAARPELAPVVDVVTRPVRHLILMAAETPGALGNDVLAAERLRLLLVGTSPAEALVPLAAAALRQAIADKRTLVNEPGLIAPGALGLVALAAARVAPDDRSAAEMVDTVHGLALEASPIEMLARLEPYGAPLDPLDAILRLLIPRYTLARLDPDFITQVMLDAVERGRWSCLQELFDRETFAKSDAWDVADADGITEVRLAAPAPDAAGGAHDRFVELRGRFDWLAMRTSWPKDVAIVFASARSQIAGVVNQIDVMDFDGGSIRVKLPAGAGRGWVGFDRLSRHEGSDRVRLRATADLASLDSPCAMVGPAPAPAAVIPLFARVSTGGAPPLVNGVPPRTRGNVLPDATASDPAGDPGADPGDAAGEDGDPIGDAGGASPDGGGLPGGRNPATIVLFLPAVVGVDGAAADQAPVSRRFVEARAAAALPVAPSIVELPWVDDPLAVVPSGIAGSDDPRLITLLEELSAAAARTPGFEHALFLSVLPGRADVMVQSTAEAARAVAACSAAALGPLLARVFVDGPADDDPAFVRATGASLVRRVAPTAALAATSFLSTSALSRLRELSQLVVRPVSTRLRLVGRLLPNGRVELETPREDPGRSAALGAPIESGLSAVALSRAGAELLRAPIHVLRAGTSPRFTLLLPLSPQVAAVELRRGTTMLKRLVRRDAPPVIRDAGVENGTVTWSFARVTSGRVDVGVEFLSGGVWAPLLVGVDSCNGEATLPFHRIRAAERLRLIVSDGWRSSVRELDVPDAAEFGPLVIRRVSDRVFWADGDGGRSFQWARAAGGKADGRRMTFSGAFAGALTLHATGDDGEDALVDRRAFGEEA
jgi:hypothetical protein